jgi:hypothetical protein
MTISIATAIPHTPWREDRVKSLQRLEVGLFPFVADYSQGFRVFSERAPLHIWSADMWRWGLEQGCDWSLFIQDDVTVCPDFYACLAAVLSSAPGGIVCLHTAHPAAKTLARQGHRWCSTADGLIGTGYALSREMLGYFLSWRQNSLRQGGAEAMTEDTMIGCYALSTRRKIYHPIPTLIDHDLTIASNFPSNAQNPFKRTVVNAIRDLDVLELDPRQLAIPAFWNGWREQADSIPHLGRLWGATPDLCARWVRGFSEESYEGAKADVCPPEYARFIR